LIVRPNLKQYLESNQLTLTKKSGVTVNSEAIFSLAELSPYLYLDEPTILKAIYDQYCDNLEAFLKAAQPVYGRL
jgi:hypothetical protein